MFRNYLTVAIRSFLNRKLYSFINVAGLAVSLACAIFIALFLRQECSWDHDLPDSRNIYMMTGKFNVPGQSFMQPFIEAPYPLAATMKQTLPEVSDTAIQSEARGTFRIGSQSFTEDFDIVSPNFFTLIKLPFITGDAANALKSPNAIILSEEIAQKYFGNVNPIGKTLILNGTYHFTVTAILKKRPENSFFTRPMYISTRAQTFRKYRETAKTRWFDINDHVLVRLVPGADPARITAELPAVIRSHADTKQIASLGISADKLLTLGMLNIRNLHLDAPEWQVTKTGRTMVHGCAAIALLILGIAIFNFTNLSTAIASLRAREVGLRKTMGARRRQLMAQFLGESVLTALIALLFALALVEVLLPGFNHIIGQNIHFSVFQDLDIVIAALGMALACGLLGGLYPAFVMSAFRPAVAQSVTRGSGRFRNYLVIGQFAISIGLGIAALVVYAQISYARNLSLGFQRDNIAVIDNAEKLSQSQRDTLVHQLRANPAVAAVAASWNYPLFPSFSLISVKQPQSGTSIGVQKMMVSPEYFDVYGIRLLAGRFLDHVHGMDTGKDPDGKTSRVQNVLIDARMAKALGFTPDTAIGQSIKVIEGQSTTMHIVGVIDTVRYNGPQTEKSMDPLIYFYNPDGLTNISVRIKGGHIPAGLKAMDRNWNALQPNIAIHRHFINDDFEKQFRSITRQARLFAIFVIIAIFVASLGLFGLAAFTAERKKKEISIRKVFGATKGQIIRLLLWRFSIPVLIANLIAWPVAYLWLHHWLEGYAYHISLSPLYFLAAGLGALAIATLTISTNAWQTASVPPAHALRSE